MESSGNEQVAEDITEFMTINDIDLTELKSLKGDNPKSPFLCFLNINSLRYKITDLRYILKHTGIEIVAVSDTKLSEEFPDAQFFIDGYTFPAYRRDRNKHGGGLIVFTKKDPITKRKKEFESTDLEIICLELTVSKRTWIIFSVYRPLGSGNLANVFSESNKCVDMATRKYENIVIMGDISIDTDNDKGAGLNKMSEFCDIFDLDNLIRGNTCVTVGRASSIDVILTNKKRSFKNSGTVATGVSDFHKMVLTTMRAHYERLKPNKIQYRSYKNFNEQKFLRDLENTPFHLCNDLIDKNLAYEQFRNMFKLVVDKHTPIKSKFILGTHAPFMNKELSKAIMHRSKLKNLHNRINTRGSWDAFKRQRNKCVAIKRKNVRTYFSLLVKDNGHNNKRFWSAVKPFLSDKGTKKSNDIVLNDDGKILIDSKEVSEVLNTYFTDIVKITTGEEPRTTSCNRDGVATDEIIEEIISRSKDHPSIKIIKSHIPQDDQKVSLKLATGNSIKKIIDKLNTKTSTSLTVYPLSCLNSHQKVYLSLSHN